MIPELLNLLTPEERAAWALCEGATPGPWKACSASDDACQCHLLWSVDGDCVIGKTLTADDATTEGEGVNHLSAVANVRHIANARTSLPVALTTIATLRQEIAELRATLANEHGEGPPIDGWRRNTTNDGMWERVLAMRPSWTSEDEGEPTDTLIVGRDDDVHWRWERYTDSGAGQRLVGGVGGIECARTAMKAADAAVKGAT